jgi:hypothetical protein
MHALRIGHQGVELLTTGRVTLPVPEPERSALRDVRAGNVSLEEVVQRINRVAAELDAASQGAWLREQPDVDAVDRFVVRAYRTAWDAG